LRRSPPEAQIDVHYTFASREFLDRAQLIDDTLLREGSLIVR